LKQGLNVSLVCVCVCVCVTVCVYTKRRRTVDVLMGTRQTKSNPPKANIYLFTFPIPQSPEFCAPSQATFLWVWCGCWVRYFLLGLGPHPLTPRHGEGKETETATSRLASPCESRRPTATSLLRGLLRSCPRLVGPPQSSSCAAGRRSRVRHTGPAGRSPTRRPMNRQGGHWPRCPPLCRWQQRLVRSSRTPDPYSLLLLATPLNPTSVL